MLYKLIINLNTKMSNQTRTLVTDSKYNFLKQLGLTTENPGLFDGRWGGSGKVSNIYN